MGGCSGVMREGEINTVYSVFYTMLEPDALINNPRHFSLVLSGSSPGILPPPFFSPSAMFLQLRATFSSKINTRFHAASSLIPCGKSE